MRDRRPTPRIIRTPLASLALASILLAGACSGVGDAIPSISVPPAVESATGSAVSGGTGVTISPNPGGLPTSSPGITGSVRTGQASISLTGGVNSTVALPTLTSPALWSPPPGAIALSWSGAGNQILTIGGPSFASQISTDAAHTLTFTVNGGGTELAFRSASGECTMAINPALPRQVGGTFLCTSLTSSDGAITVNAQGTFSATG